MNSIPTMNSNRNCSGLMQDENRGTPSAVYCMTYVSIRGVVFFTTAVFPADGPA